MLTEELDDIKNLLRVTEVDLVVDPVNQIIKMGPDLEIKYTILSGAATLIASNLNVLSKFPKVIETLVAEVDRKTADARFWEMRVKSYVHIARTVKLNTIRNCIKLIRTIYIPTKSALLVMKEVRKRLQEFKAVPIEELTDDTSNALFFTIEPPQIPKMP